MNKILDFFNKISGLVIFLIFVVVFIEHIHHAHFGRWGHHPNFGSHRPYGDSVRAKMDSTSLR